MRERTSFALIVLALSVAAQAQSSAATACQQVKGSYHCDRAAFVKSLSAARTVALQTQPYDRNSQRELAELATQLGKTIAAANADLLFRLEKPDPQNPIYYGPNSRALAVLRIYSRGPHGAHGPLIWTETLTGQPGLPWPIVVHQVIRQFKADTKQPPSNAP